MVGKLQEKLALIGSEVREAEDVRERLRCQLNLVKLQTVTLMKQMDERMLEAADIKVDFRAKLQQTRVKKAGTTPRKDGYDSSRSSNSRKPSGSGTDLAKNAAFGALEKKLQ